MKTLNKGSQPKIELEYSSIPKVFFDTIKVGIIKSNLIAMLAGLCLALYVCDASFIANTVRHRLLPDHRGCWCVQQLVRLGY